MTQYSIANIFTEYRSHVLKLVLLGLLFLSAEGSTLQANKPSAKIYLNLDTAVRVGAANFYALKSIDNRTAVTRKLITERWRSYLPTLALSYNRTVDVNIAEADTLRHELRATITEVIYDGGQRELELDVAKIELLLARQDFRVTYTKLKLEIQKAYLKVLAARGKIVLNQKSVERAREQLRLSRREEQLGAGTRVQSLTVASRLREIELALRKSISQHRQGLNELKLTLNLNYETELELAGEIYRDFYLFPPNLNIRQLVQSGRGRRIEIQRATTTIHRRKKEQKISENYWIPRFSVSGYAARSGERLPVRDPSWGVNFTLTFPLGSSTTNSQSGIAYSANGNRKNKTNSSTVQLFDDLSAERKILESRIAMGEAVADYKQLSNKVANEVVQSAEELKQSWEAIRIGNGRVYFQAESLRLLRTRYRVGEVKRSDILLQEMEMVRAQIDLTDAIVSYLTAAYQLEFASGLDAGSLKLFKIRTGQGNTLLPYIISNDFEAMKRNIRKRPTCGFP